MKNYLLALALTLAGCLSNAEANAPVSMNKADEYARAGALRWGHYQAVADTTTPFLNDTGTYTDERDLELFEWGTRVTISCAAVTCICLAMDDDSITLTSGTGCGNVADTGTPGDSAAGVCTQVNAAPDRRTFIVARAAFPDATVAATSVAGTRSNVCSTASTGTPGYPCDATNDCLTAAGGAGTCVTPTISNPIRGAFILGIGAAGTNCFVTEEI
jgi:hypothetical protein